MGAQIGRLHCQSGPVLNRARIGASLATLVPTTLVFSTQPGGAVINEPFTTQPVVTVKDQNGNTLTSYTGQVTMAMDIGSPGVLSGTTTVSCVAGVATFTNLEIDEANVGVRIAATIPELFPATFASAPFDVASDDPLAGFTWSMRLQNCVPGATGTPLGLYQDTAGTTPATQDFESIGGIRRTLGGSAVFSTQSVAEKQPYLFFDNGVPTIVGDEVDDFLNYTDIAGLTEGTVFIVCNRTLASAGYEGLITLKSQFGIYSKIASSAFWGVFDGSNRIAGEATGATYTVLTVRRSALATELRTDGGAWTTRGKSTEASFGSFILSDSGTSQFHGGGLVALLISPSELNDSDCGIVETYLAQIKP